MEATDLENIEKKVKEKFTEEQMCTYFLTKTIRSLYQFDDEFVSDWYEKIFERKAKKSEDVRKALVQAYTRMLMVENKYENHLSYWAKLYGDNLLTEMESFFAGEPGK